MPITQEDLDNWFTYHPPTGETQMDAYLRLRVAGKMFAEVIMKNCPSSADQTAAIRKVREAVMTAKRCHRVRRTLKGA